MSERDTYGSKLRDRMKQSMAEPHQPKFRPLNRREDAYDKVSRVACNVLGFLVFVCIVTVMTLQVYRWIGR